MNDASKNPTPSSRSSALTLTNPKASGLSFRANVSWALIGSLVHSFANWATLLVLARVSDPETVGTFALAAAISGPFFTFFNGQLRAIQATDALQRFPSSTFTTVRLATSALALTLIALYSIISNKDTATIAVLILYSFNLAFTSISDVIFGHFQKLGRQDLVARSQATRGLLSLLILSLTFILWSSLPLATAGLALASLIPLILFDLPTARNFHLLSHHLQRPFFEQLRDLSRSAVPLGATMLLLSLNQNIPRYILEAHAGRQDLGIFAALSQLIAAGSLLITSIGQAMSPRLARAFHSGQLHSFKHDLARFAGLAAAISIGGILLSATFGRQILSLIYGPAYAAASHVLLMLSTGGSLTFLAGVAGSALTACGFHKIQPALFTTTVAVTAFSAYILVPKTGIYGAAISVVSSGLVQLLITWGALLYSLRAATHER